jgi:general secretion pathway protein J
LASLLVVSLMVLMMAEGIDAGRTAWRRLDQREANGELMEAAQSTLRDRIEQAYPKTIYNINPETVDFHGAQDSLLFVATPPEASRPSPLRRYSLKVDAAGELVLASASDVDPSVASTAARQVLLNHVRGLEMAYFGAAGLDQLRQWRPTWDLQPEPPELVRVRVTFAPGDPRQWPELIVHPRATIDAGCAIDANTHGCRGRS